ncbi:MAG: hypothetical protein AAGG79_06805, partial [Pseudomonadota bacterium]
MGLNRSLIGRVMNVAILASVFIIAAVSAVVYGMTFKQIREFRLERLEERTTAKAHEQMAVFEQLDTILTQARQVYKATAAELDAEGQRELFEQAFPPFGDGTRRSTSELFNGTIDREGRAVEGIGGFIPDASSVEDQRLINVMAGYDIVRTVGPSLDYPFTDFWFFSADGDVIVYAPQSTDALASYRQELPANYDLTSEPIAALARPQLNPDRRLQCADIAPMANRPRRGRQTLTSRCQIPVDDADGRYIGSIGTTVLLSDWLRETVRLPDKAGFRYMVVSPEFGLLAHTNFGDRPDAGLRAALSEAEGVPELQRRLTGESGAFL